MFKKVLVPLDGSELAERALEPALTIARACDAEILLLTVPVYHYSVPPAATGYGPLAASQIVDLSRNDAEKYLAELRRQARCQECRIRNIVVEGDVAGCIVDTATAEQVDLIIMTTHGYSGFTRWMLGSITERVLRSASCPVLAVRESVSLCKALITLDGSPRAEFALAPGMELARLLGCQVTLLFADQGEDPGSVEQGLLRMAGAGACQEMLEAGEDRLDYYLECLARQYRSDDLLVKTKVVRAKAAEAILSYAEAEAIDLIVMTTHGHTGLRRWVFGSVTEKILRQAGRAMLIVRPPLNQQK